MTLIFLNTKHRHLNGDVVDDVVQLQDRKHHPIGSILVSKHSAHSNLENEYPHFILLTVNNVRGYLDHTSYANVTLSPLT